MGEREVKTSDSLITAIHIGNAFMFCLIDFLFLC